MKKNESLPFMTTRIDPEDVMEPAGSWGMIRDYHRLNQVVAVTTAAPTRFRSVNDTREYGGLSGPRTFRTPILTSSPAPPPRGSAGLGLGHREAKAVCKQASSASLQDVRAGPGVRGCARPGPGANLSGASASANTPGRNGTEARSRGVGEAAAAAGRPVRPARGLLPGPFPAAEGHRARDRVAPHSPRAAATAATAWPGGSSLSRQPPPPEDTGAAPGAAAKPPAPEGVVVAAVTEAQSPPSLIGLTGRRSHAVPGGAPLNRAGGARLRRDDRGAAGGDPRRSLQRRRGRSCRRRRWATAPPGPHARLRRRDCGGRPDTSGRERGGARPGDGGGPALTALPSAPGRPPTMPPGRRKPLDLPQTVAGASPTPSPQAVSAFAPFPSLQEMCGRFCHSDVHLRAGEISYRYQILNPKPPQN
ncbi:transcription initiation factor TFIID subunit 4-like [Meles meles]|uniref:transcription initiation factor TFIID subunit 4-like n=1 Tax=Meles meles TaxID=9662 RepID=UPI001E699A0C|nr:transcription initiation factor TFIID subunit 4-like [Meles meles]